MKSAREREHRRNKFLAAIQGIDIDSGSQEEAKEAFARAQRRAEAILTGESEQKLEYDEFGLDIEVEE